MRAVALVRLALPSVQNIQVDWAQYGPKLAQVALTFGANDLDRVSTIDDETLGRRRTSVEDVRRNIAAAGFRRAVERASQADATLRLGAVSYLNTKPLVYGLDAYPDQFDVRFDVPSKCATLLHEGKVDLGLIPAIEYLRGDYCIVPDVSIASDGDVATVAVFTRKPIAQVRTLALDLSSRTSVALTRVLCAKHWHIAPSFTPAEPDLEAMLARADAALRDRRSGVCDRSGEARRHQDRSGRRVEGA